MQTNILLKYLIQVLTVLRKLFKSLQFFSSSPCSLCAGYPVKTQNVFSCIFEYLKENINEKILECTLYIVGFTKPTILRLISNSFPQFCWFATKIPVLSCFTYTFFFLTVDPINNFFLWHQVFYVCLFQSLYLFQRTQLSMITQIFDKSEIYKFYIYGNVYNLNAYSE